MGQFILFINWEEAAACALPGGSARAPPAVIEVQRRRAQILESADEPLNLELVDFKMEKSKN